MIIKHMTLGKLITKLKSRDGEAGVYFDFCNLIPTSFNSYRGYYEQLALGYTDDMQAQMTVSRLRESAIECLDDTFTGYKGGEYKMTRDTKLWADNIGRASGTAITGIIDEGWRIILKTKYRGDL
jgi:hypothetical protein